MKIFKTLVDGKLTYVLEGRLDTLTAPELSKALEKDLGNVHTLRFDFGKLEYISSAGLRLLVAAQKQMSAKGAMSLLNVGEDVMEVLNITGLSDILTIE